MRLRVSWLLTLLSLVAVSVLANPLPSAEQQSLRTFRFALAGHRYALYEVDIGRPFRCSGRYVGVALRDEKATVLWSFNVSKTAGYLAVHGCWPGVSAATIVGTAVPSREEAIWVIQELSCGASCAGYNVHVFRFSPQFSTPDLPVFKEFEQSLGLGGVKFDFPRLVLYVNNGYKECPSHWTRMIYRWTAITSSQAQFILIDAISYTSRQCYLRNTVWPPDPGQ